MSTYTDVFGNDTVPPSGLGYASFTITTNTTFVWPYNTDGNPYPVAKVMDVACAAGNAITLPDAREVSTGEDFLIRNVGFNTLIVKDATGVQIASVAVGAASYFYLTDNTTAAGVYGVIGFGVGTSTVDAASLVGYGIKAVGASLNQSHPVFPAASGITVDVDHRAKLIVFTGGTATFNLTTATTLGDDYFTMFRNEGTGTATIDPAAGELIDGMSTMQVQPGESLMLICAGTQWYSVGYGRSVLYQFTQLTKDVSAGGTITLTAAEAANKLMTFIGNPSGAVNVVVPSIVAVYYTQSAISTAQTITLKTAAGSGVGISQGARIIALCDGTNVVSAQSAVANTSVSLTDGSAAVPALFFATQTNTGLYKSGTQDLGVTVNGSTVGVFGSTGLQTSTIGANSTQRHTVPAVGSDTVALLAATQTFTNKTFTSPTITGAALTGGTINNSVIGGVTPAAGTFTTLTTTGNIELGNASDTTLARSAAGVVTIEGVEVVTLSRSQTLTNKTISVDNNTVSGIAASSFVLSNASGNIDGAAAQKAIPAGVVVGTTDSQTLTNKTISGANNTLSNIGNSSLTNSSITVNGSVIALGGSATITAVNPNALTIGTGLSGTSYNGSSAVTIAIDSTVATLTGSQTLTNKTFNLASNTLTGTKAQFDTALSDDNFAYLGQANSFAANQSPSVDNTYSLGTASFKWSNVYATTFTEGTYPLASQNDIGTAPNEIPLNQYLGGLAYLNTEMPALDVGRGITTGTGTICKANGGAMGGIYRMTIVVDLTGLNSGGTAGNIIGVNGTTLPCYIGLLPTMTVLGGRMTCLETPAGGDTDIDLYSATEGTGVEDQAISALTETQLINAGAQTVGTVTYFAADPTVNAYLYLVGQGTANATYTAGRFLIEIFGVQ